MSEEKTIKESAPEQAYQRGYQAGQDRVVKELTVSVNKLEAGLRGLKNSIFTAVVINSVANGSWTIGGKECVSVEEKMQIVDRYVKSAKERGLF